MSEDQPIRVWNAAKTEYGTVIAEMDDADCGVESCTATVYLVEWPDGEQTECCYAALDELDNGDLHITN